MDLATFKAALRRAWAPASIVLVVIVIGSFVYVAKEIPPGAQGSVAVRDSLSVNNGGGSSAGIAFDAIIESARLAKMVGQQLRLPEASVKGALSVSTVASTTGIDISPLYVVKAKAKTVRLAEAIVNAAITQGRALYAQLDSANTAQEKAQLATELQSANAQLTSATSDFDAFVVSSGGDHSAQMSTLESDISALTAEFTAASAAHASTSSLQAQLDAAQNELSSIEPVQARYEQLSTALTAAQQNVQQITGLQQLTDAAAVLPVGQEVKVLDYASPAGSGVLKILIYALGIIVGLIAAFTILYSEAARQRRQLSSKELVAALGLSTLGRIPPCALPREV